ncbi:MAG TPA: ABC transporter permease [Actinomycetes bacterium]|nr:ABC transporter permease [Actinomycetes bacterium]
MTELTATLARPTGRVTVAQKISDAMVMTWRQLLQTVRVPELLVFATIQPIMFVLLFAYLWGGAVPLPDGASYKEYLVPGIFVQTVAFTTAATSVGLAEDLKRGLIDRFRSLPMARSAVLFGRTLGDTTRNVLVLFIMSVCGLLVGWRIRDGVLSAIAAYFILMLFGYAMSWIGAFAGLSVSSPEAANNLGFIWLFPLTFLSNAFVPVDTLPDWLQVVANWNPISAVTAAVRDLFGNPNPITDPPFPIEHAVPVSIGWCLLILAIFIPLSVRKYRNKQ